MVLARGYEEVFFGAGPVFLRENVRINAHKGADSKRLNPPWEWGRARVVSPLGLPLSREPNTGPSSALKVKFRKLTTPVAVPLSSGGFTSLMTEYGSMAAPDAIPIRMPTAGPRKTEASPNRTQASTPVSMSAPARMTG